MLHIREEESPFENTIQNVVVAGNVNEILYNDNGSELFEVCLYKSKEGYLTSKDVLSCRLDSMRRDSQSWWIK